MPKTCTLLKVHQFFFIVRLTWRRNWGIEMLSQYLSYYTLFYLSIEICHLSAKISRLSITLSHTILDWKEMLHIKLIMVLNRCIWTEDLVTQKSLQSTSEEAAFQSPFDLTSTIHTIKDISFPIGHHHGNSDCMFMTEKCTWN